MNGRNNRQEVDAFRLQVDTLALSEITELSESLMTTKMVEELIDLGAPIEDVRTAEILLALIQYMKDRNVDPGFEVTFE